MSVNVLYSFIWGADVPTYIVEHRIGYGQTSLLYHQWLVWATMSLDARFVGCLIHCCFSITAFHVDVFHNDAVYRSVDMPVPFRHTSRMDYSPPGLRVFDTPISGRKLKVENHTGTTELLNWRRIITERNWWRKTELKINYIQAVRKPILQEV